jgi:hypothetical protein
MQPNISHMPMDGWSRNEALEDERKKRVWQKAATSEELYVEDMTVTGQGYTVFLYDDSICRWMKIDEFSTLAAAIDHAVAWAEQNA